MATVRDQVFISYARQDRVWLERLRVYLKPLERDHKLIIWDDTHIKPGDKWRQEIRSALDQAKVAVMLMSPHFLASDFITKNEVPDLVKAAETEGLTILWVSISHCMHKLSPVTEYQAVNDPAQPLDTLSPAERGRVLTQVAELIMKALDTPIKVPASSAKETAVNKSEESEAQAPAEHEQKPTRPDQANIHVEGNVSRSILGGSIGDNANINFGDR